MYLNLNENDASKLADQFEVDWKEEKYRIKGKPRILNVIWRVCVSKMIGFSFLYSVFDIILKWVEIMIVCHILMTKKKQDKNETLVC